MALGMRYTREIWIAGWSKGESGGQDPVWAAFGRQRQIGEVPNILSEALQVPFGSCSVAR